MKRVVLAYSGGLDTSVAIKWMGEQGCEVFPVAIDIGQGDDLDDVVERGKQAGAAACAWCARPTGSRRSSSRRRSRRTRSTRGSTPWSRARPPADRPGGRQGRSRRRRRRRRPRMYRQGKRSGAPRSLRRPRRRNSRCSRRSAESVIPRGEGDPLRRGDGHTWRRSRRRIRSTRTSGDGRRSAVRWRIRGWRRRRTRSPGRPRPTIDPRSPPRSSSTSTVAGRSPSTAVMEARRAHPTDRRAGGRLQVWAGRHDREPARPASRAASCTRFPARCR